MALPTDLVKINNISLPKLKAYKVQPNKLWTEAGRNMAGDLRSTFIGIFHKLLLEFAPTTEAECSTIINLINLPSFTVAWYDEATDSMKTGTFYAGDFDYSVLKKADGIYDAFSVNLIPFSKTA